MVIIVGYLEQERVEDLAESGEIIVRWLADDFGEGCGCGGKRGGDFLWFHRGWGRVRGGERGADRRQLSVSGWWVVFGGGAVGEKSRRYEEEH